MKPGNFGEPRLATDEELAILTDYVGGFMTAAEEEAFERRLEEDSAFFLRVAPILDVWYSRDPLLEARVQRATANKKPSVPRWVRKTATWFLRTGMVAAALIVTAMFFGP